MRVDTNRAGLTMTEGQPPDHGKPAGITADIAAIVAADIAAAVSMAADQGADANCHQARHRLTVCCLCYYR